MFTLTSHVGEMPWGADLGKCDGASYDCSLTAPCTAATIIVCPQLASPELVLVRWFTAVWQSKRIKQ